LKLGKYLILYVQCPIFLFIFFKKKLIFSKYFHIRVQYKFSQKSFQWETCWCIRTDGRTWSKIAFISTMPTHIRKKRVAAEVIYKTQFCLGEILEMLTQHYIMYPATRRPLEYSDRSMACNFVPSEAMVYISSRHCNDLRQRNHRAALNSRSLSHIISYFGSLPLIRALRETIQSAATIKCALGCSV